MKILLDENFPKKSVSLLEKYGFEIIDIRGTKSEGLQDKKIFDIAIKEKALFLTTDKDFYHTIHFNNKPHKGIVVITLSQPNAINIIEKLDWFLKTFSNENFNNKCYLINNNKCKIYS
ncbi:MAG: DUF5615 family PIN-like protein [Spirochaetes bacterium]|nr:DUF5615 family PIN-like protein [Spirochaetota bacterium]